ncbi:MAG: hypothetical protein ACRC6M_17750, partial [Microcystaceae cyanobacterium]
DSLNTLLSDKSVPTRYWRIGRGEKVSAPQELSATEFLKARSPEFYEACEPNAKASNFPCVSSTLEQIYDTGGENPKQETLRILLTDLEPDGAAVGQLSGKISSELKTHNNYKAVLLGVRSEYDGAIFLADTGKTAGRYSTQGKNVDREGRPFYVLMTGPSAAVDAMIKRFQQLPLDVNQAIRASSFAIAGKDTLVMDKSKIPLQINSCTQQTGAINRQRPKANQQDQWLLMEQKCQGKPLELAIPSQESVVLAGSEKLTPESFQVSNNAVEVKNVSVNRDQLALNLIIDGSKFAKKKGQMITITLQKRDLDKATWQGWDTDVATPDGAKTQNLDLFIGGLRDSVENVVQNTDKKQATQEAVKYCLGFTRYE